MADATVPETRQTMGLRARRIRLLWTAVDLFGHQRAADALGIERRSLRAKLEATRGVHDDNLLLVASALDRHAATLVDHASTIRAALAGGASAT